METVRRETIVTGGGKGGIINSHRNESLIDEYFRKTQRIHVFKKYLSAIYERLKMHNQFSLMTMTKYESNISVEYL